MDNNELLIAIRSIVKGEVELIIDRKLKPINDRLEKIEEKFEPINERLEKIEEKLDFVAEVLEGTLQMHDKLDQRVKELESIA